MLDLPSDLPAKVIPLAWLVGNWRGWGTARLHPAAVTQLPALRSLWEQAHASSEAAETAGAESAEHTEPASVLEIYIWQESKVEVVGETLRQVTTTWQANPTRQKLELTENAQQGLAKLRRGVQLWQEELTWKFSHSVPAGAGQEQPVSRCEVTQQGGIYGPTTWQANSLGPRIMAQGTVAERAVTEAVAAAGNEQDTKGASSSDVPELSTAEELPQVEGLSRMFGLVSSELFWAQDVQLSASQPTNADGPAGGQDPETITDFSARLARVAQ